MGIQATPVYNTGDQDGLAWPDITWVGTQIKRRAAMYSEQWYAEYACWDAAAGATFTVGGSGVTADFYMISPGETGTAETTSGPGSGGGAGVQYSWSSVTLPSGNYVLTVSQTQTRVDGQIDPLIAATPSGGAAAGTPYKLYGEDAEVYGQAGNKIAPTVVIPGTGASGCMFLPVKAADTVYGSSSTRVGRVVGAAGVGAGGNGGARTDYMYTALQTLTQPGAGAAGMILMRVLLTGGN
ncbi:hypothetical protein FACS1894184_00610 [Clostridia bacterium]|nr:hypothetical protein FACS1894184_00610 [Clostridia bacterium]